jgi:hypothetical protein
MASHFRRQQKRKGKVVPLHHATKTYGIMVEDGAIKMHFKETGFEDVDWIHLAQQTYSDELLRTGNEPLGSIKKLENFLEFFDTRN